MSISQDQRSATFSSGHSQQKRILVLLFLFCGSLTFTTGTSPILCLARSIRFWHMTFKPANHTTMHFNLWLSSFVSISTLMAVSHMMQPYKDTMQTMFSTAPMSVSRVSVKPFYCLDKQSGCKVGHSNDNDYNSIKVAKICKGRLRSNTNRWPDL